jgi:hypothetical protein
MEGGSEDVPLLSSLAVVGPEIAVEWVGDSVDEGWLTSIVVLGFGVLGVNKVWEDVSPPVTDPGFVAPESVGVSVYVSMSVVAITVRVTVPGFLAVPVTLVLVVPSSVALLPLLEPVFVISAAALLEMLALAISVLVILVSVLVLVGMPVLKLPVSLASGTVVSAPSVLLASGSIVTSGVVRPGTLVTLEVKKGESLVTVPVLMLEPPV